LNAFSVAMDVLSPALIPSSIIAIPFTAWFLFFIVWTMP
jgi:hypothetical protein